MPFMFEKLIVYQKAMAYIDEALDVVEAFPGGYGFLANQLGRASVSIATNLAEGNGRFTKADRRHFFVISRGSVQECVPLLDLAAQRNLLDANRQQRLRDQLDEISRMLSGLITGLDRRAD